MRATINEPLAKALCDFDVDHNGGYVWEHRGDSWGSEHDNGRDYYRDMAAATLALIAAAMLSEEAVEAGATEIDSMRPDNVMDDARFVIEAALTAAGITATQEGTDDEPAARPQE